MKCMDFPMFQGIYTALYTPFSNGGVDRRALSDLIKRQMDGGVSGLVPIGTTGESPCLSDEETFALIGQVVAEVSGQVKVVAGVGVNSTDLTVARARKAVALGVDAVMVVMPYYNKPTPEGQFQHFKAVANAVDVPVWIYNIPGRSVVDMSPETMSRLVQACPNIVAVKDATGKMDRVAQQRAACGDDFIQLSGDDDSMLPFLREGGHGCVSVASNIVPADMVKLYGLHKSGDHVAADALQKKMLPLFSALFLETNPAPIKYAAHLMGKCSPEMRLPMVQPRPETCDKIRKALQDYGLLNA